MPSTVTPLELVYTACMLANLVTTLANLVWAQRALNDLKRLAMNGQVEVLRRGARNDQIMLLIVAVCLVSFGFIALGSPSNPRVSTNMLIVSGGAFIILSACLMWLSIAIRLRPRQLRRAGLEVSK
jgi:hypothetical protein